MKYAYGATITILDPSGKEIQAQVGQNTHYGPMIHIPSHQIEAPADELAREGWQIPEMSMSTGPSRTHSYAAEAEVIVDALLNDEEIEIARKGAAEGPRKLGDSSRGRIANSGRGRFGSPSRGRFHREGRHTRPFE